MKNKFDKKEPNVNADQEKEEYDELSFFAAKPESVEEKKPAKVELTQKEKDKAFKKNLILGIIAFVLIGGAIAGAIFIYIQNSQVLYAKFNGGKIKEQEFVEEFTKVAARNGVTGAMMNDDQYKSDIEGLQNETLSNMVNTEIIMNNLKEYGYNKITDEMRKEATAEGDELMTNYVSYNMESILAGLPEGYSQEQLELAINNYKSQTLTSLGMTSREELEEYFIDGIIIEKAKEKLFTTEDIAPTDDEIMTEYESTIEQQKRIYDKNLARYIEDHSEDIYDSYYVPAGIRSVRHVLVGIDEATSLEINELVNNNDNAAANKKYEEALIEAEIVAQEIRQMIINKEISMEDAIIQYGSDPGMVNNDVGYYMCEGFDKYVPEFIIAGMGLAKVGNISELVPSQYGYHIMEYFTEIPTSTVSYEDVKDEIYEMLVDINRNQSWADLATEWIIAAEVEYLVDMG